MTSSLVYIIEALNKMTLIMKGDYDNGNSQKDINRRRSKKIQ